MALPSNPTTKSWDPANTGRIFTGTERYEIVRKVGEGGMGVVYEAIDRLRGRHVAVKTLNRFDADAIYRIKQEFRSLADVAHPNLVKLHELVSEDDAWFFTMELVDGGDLLRWLHGQRPPRVVTDDPTPELPSNSAAWAAGSGAHVSLPIGDEEQTEPVKSAPSVRLAMPKIVVPGQTPIGQVFGSVREVNLQRLGPAIGQLAEALMALHETGRLHRDIKPTNVMVTETGRVVLLDFGLVTPMYDRYLVRSTVQGMVCGTVAYMSPEQGAGDALTPASDWYSVGVILYEALTGRLPFRGSMFRVLMDKQQAQPPSPLEVVPDVPEHLDALCRALLSTNPSARPTGEQILEQLGCPVQVDLTPAPVAPVNLPGHFVGRGPQLEAMQSTLQLARSGRAQAVLVQGQSGVGKTTLIRHFLDSAVAESEITVLVGRSHERELLPFKGFDGIIDSLSRYLRSLPYDEAAALLPPDAPLLVHLFPILGRVEAINALKDPSLASKATLELRGRAFDALRTLLDRLARRTTLIVFMDDLQWGDADSAELLSFVLAAPNPPPLLLLGSCRVEDHQESPLLASIAALEQAPQGLSVCRLMLRPLALPEAENLARILLTEHSGESPAQDLAARAQLVALESGGDPLFVYELAQRDAEGQDFARPVDGDNATPQRGLRLQNVLYERICGLPFAARRLLEVIAVCAGPVEPGVGQDAAGLKAGDDWQVELLRAQRLVRSSLGGNEGLEVYHDRVRTAVLHNLSDQVQRAHHLSLARVLQARPEPDAEALTLHLIEAGHAEQAARYARSAAQRAFESTAFERAASLYAMALNLAPAASDKRWQLQGWLAESLASAGQGPAAAETYLVASQSCPGSQGFELRRRAAVQYLTCGHSERGLSVLTEMLTQVGLQYPKSAGQAVRSIALMRARALLAGNKFEPKASADIPRRLKQQIDVCWSLATGLAMVDVIRAAYFGARMLALALAAGDRVRLIRAMAVEGVLIGAMQRSDDYSLRMLEVLKTTADGLEQPEVVALVMMREGFSAYLRGQWSHAETQMAAALEIFTTRCNSVAWEINTCRLIYVEAISNQGRYFELGDTIRRSMAMAVAVDNRLVTTMYRTFPYVTVLQLVADQPAQLRGQLNEGLEGPSTTELTLTDYSRLVSITNVELYEGKGSEAFARVNASWPALESSKVLKVQLLASEAYYMRARAALAAAGMGKDDEPLHKVATEAGKALAQIGLPHVPAMVALIKAQKACLRGNIPRARELFRAARRGFETTQMGAYAAVARRREGQCIAGDLGRGVVESADRLLVEQGVLRPQLFARMLCPVGVTTESPGVPVSS